MATENTNSDALKYLAIKRTQDTYADIITRRAFGELPSVMSTDCRLDIDLRDRQMVFEGPKAIGDFISKQMERFDFFVFEILNTIIEIDPAGERGAARMYISEHRTDHDGNLSLTYGVYHDLFELQNGEWKISRRKYASYGRTDPDDNNKLVTFELPEISLSQLLSEHSE